MAIFSRFEAEVLDLLVTPALGAGFVARLVSEAGLVSYNFSGSGYFLTVRHPDLPSERLVCAQPQVLGSLGQIQTGFVVFIEQAELMLECHTWDPVAVPADFREQDVKVSLG